jgi:hypothetical protein
LIRILPVGKREVVSGVAVVHHEVRETILRNVEKIVVYASNARICTAENAIRNALVTPPGNVSLERRFGLLGVITNATAH